MNAHSRFDLETAIATWRRFVLSERSISSEDADELESHLRDEIDERVAVGLEPDAAFKQAVRRLGDYALLERSYRRVYWKKLQAEHRITNELQWRGAMLKNYLKFVGRCCMNQLARCTCPNPARLSGCHVALRHTQRRHPVQNPTLDPSFNLLILHRACP